MIPATREDINISRMYTLERLPNFSPERYRSTYEPIFKNKKSILGGFINFIGLSLDDILINLANQYDLTRPEDWRSIDKKAYNQITMCRRCRKNHELKRYYYKMYKELVKPFLDLENGIVFIDDQEEDSGVDPNF